LPNWHPTTLFMQLI